MTTHPRDLVAVPDTSCVMHEVTVKQLAMMFDRIAMPPLSFMNHNTYETPEIKKTRAWLVSIGVLFESDWERLKIYIREGRRNSAALLKDDVDVLLKPQATSVDEVLAARDDPERLKDIKDRAAQVTPESLFDLIDPEKLAGSIQRTISTITRIQTIGFRSVEKLDAYAVIAGDHSSLDQDDALAPKHHVLRFVLSLPAPDEQVPWQRIIEYRSDGASRSQFFILKTCLSDIARGLIPATQVQETLDYLLNRYHYHMNLHHSDVENKRMEVFVVTTAEIAAGFEAIRWSTNADAMFALERCSVALLEGESTAAGSELAYVIESKSIFSST